LQNSPIQLGSINLQDFEIPPSVRFGGRHRLAVHVLAGGRRIVERLGPDDDNILFRGTFSGATAEARARAFDNLRMSGDIVWLTWESFRRRVVVKSFIADYHSPWWIPYQLSCLVVHQTGIASSQSAGVAALLLADLGSAMTAASGYPITLTSVQAVLSTPNVFATGSSDQTRAIAAVGSTLGVLHGQIDQQSMSLMTSIPSSTPPAALGRSYNSKVGSAGSLAAVVNVSSYVGRIGTNILGLGT
jgi:hypothetical protein